MKETINLRIQDLMTKGRELEQQLQQINGALQQCQWTLAELEKEEAPEVVAE
jgi:chaperonin cofactor prefoldin